MKPETLAAALTQWRTAFLTDTMPAAVVVDNHVLTLETTLLLAAENIGSCDDYTRLVAHLRSRLGVEYADELVRDACANG
jgi:hypothetical protein